MDTIAVTLRRWTPLAYAQPRPGSLCRFKNEATGKEITSHAPRFERPAELVYWVWLYTGIERHTAA